jgi:2-oxoglutarate ferredoxin oxidoreductase subunit beta
MRLSEIPIDRHVVVSGIGCTSRLPGYLKLDTYHTTHGRAIPFATGLKIANPDLEVTVIAGDGDLLNIGGNHLIHAARRNIDLNVFCVNNFTYGMTGGQFGGTTPLGATTSTTPYGNFEMPFNVPHVIAAAGAPFVARWTTMHVKELFNVMLRAFRVNGLAFVEIVSPCPPAFGEQNDFKDANAMMEHFRANSRVDNTADVKSIGITMKPHDPVILGNFVDVSKPTYHDLERSVIRQVEKMNDHSQRA